LAPARPTPRAVTIAAAHATPSVIRRRRNARLDRMRALLLAYVSAAVISFDACGVS
jgi:hypothetical protein